MLFTKHEAEHGMYDILIQLHAMELTISPSSLNAKVRTRRQTTRFHPVRSRHCVRCTVETEANGVCGKGVACVPGALANQHIDCISQSFLRATCSCSEQQVRPTITRYDGGKLQISLSIRVTAASQQQLKPCLEHVHY